jgi:hypothetical protein
MQSRIGSSFVGALLIGVFLLGPARMAAAREGKIPGESVALDLQALYCLSQGDWCPPTGELPRVVPEVPSEVGLRPSGQETAQEASRRATAADLGLEVPRLPGLENVALDAAGMVCYSEGEWCLLLPRDRQSPDELGL